MSALNDELKLSAEVKLSSLNPVMYPLTIESPGSRLVRDEIRRRYGERAGEAFLLGLEIRGAIYQAQDGFFDYGEISIDGISGTTTYGQLSDRAGTFGAEAKTAKEVQEYIDDNQSRWEKIAPAEEVANRALEEAVETTNSVVRIELQSLEYHLSEAISEQQASSFARNAFLMIVAGTLIVGAIVFVFRLREA